MSSFSTNVKGRVKEVKIALEKCYIPLFECLSNSIHATSTMDINQASIIININRQKVQKLSFIEKTQDESCLPVSDVEVVDNGVGFNDVNFISFLTCNSDLKENIGGKGIGRFTWLKVFESADIESIYMENQTPYLRKFSFKMQNNLENEIIEKYPKYIKNKTSVCLHNLKSEFQDYFPNDIRTLADLIIEHFLLNFITNKMPEIIIKDKYQGEINVNRYYQEQKSYEIKDEELKIYNSLFTIYHIKSYSIKMANNCYLCADLRVADKIDLRSEIPNLQSDIGLVNGEKAWYRAYVCSDYLNTIVNSERTQLNYPQIEVSNEAFDNITKETLKKELILKITNYLKKDLTIIEEKKESKLILLLIIKSQIIDKCENIDQTSIVR